MRAYAKLIILITLLILIILLILLNLIYLNASNIPNPRTTLPLRDIKPRPPNPLPPLLFVGDDKQPVEALSFTKALEVE